MTNKRNDRLMTRRGLLTLAALLGVLGMVLVPAASQAAPSASVANLSVAAAPSVSPQVGMPPGIVGLGAILERVFQSIMIIAPGPAEMLRDVFADTITRLSGGCTYSFCASP